MLVATWAARRSAVESRGMAEAKTLQGLARALRTRT
jgi:hypothetical protein